MPNFILGMNAKIYQGTTGDLVSAMTEMDNVRDVTMNLEAGEADVTTRANAGWRATAATLREASVDFEMVWKTTDAGFVAIRDAYLNGTEIELAVLSEDYLTSGSQGPKGSFTISNFSRGEALEEAIIMSVTAKMATIDSTLPIPGWYVKA